MYPSNINRPSRATTLRPENGVRQCNTRLDPRTLRHLENLKAHYSNLTGLRANSGTIVRRAIRLLASQIQQMDPDQEDRIIRQCGKGKECI